MKRTLFAVSEIAESIPFESPPDLAGRLVELAATHKLKWLLAHADDGVVWGRFEESKLFTSHEAGQDHPEARHVCAELRAVTLQQARLFGINGELLVRRTDDGGLQARLIRPVKDGENVTWTEAFDETYLLWGTHGEPLPNNFTLLRDGAQGLLHAVPFVVPLDKQGRAAPPPLIVRQYLAKETAARIVGGRLVGFETEKRP